MPDAIKLEPVKLKELHIERVLWGDDKGQFTGKVELDGPNGRIMLVLPHDLSLKYLQVSAEILSQISTQAAERLKADVLASVEEAKALPAAAQPLSLH